MPARVCNVISASACGVPKRGPDKSGAKRILAVGMTPEHSLQTARRAWAFAALFAAVYVAMVVLSRRRRKGPPRISEEHAWTLPIEAAEIAARIRKLEGEDRFLVVDEGPGRLVFIQGYSENAARGWGIRKAPVFPRRATLTWRSSPREPTQVTARIEEDLVWHPSAFTPTMDRLAREAIASTRARMESALGVR
jgi:hypothetical protein